MIYERLTQPQRKKLRQGAAGFLSALAISPLIPSASLSQNVEPRIIPVAEQQPDMTSGTNPIDEVRLLLHATLRVAQEQVPRNEQRVQMAIPTPYVAPTPDLSSFEVAPIPALTPHSQYFFGTDKVALKKFTQLGAAAHQIAEVEYVFGKVHGYSNTEIGCMEDTTVMESGNDVTATNSKTKAYGLPQSLPASKMAVAGSDYRTNALTQLKWMDEYMKERYGGPCETWAHWDEDHSY